MSCRAHPPFAPCFTCCFGSTWLVSQSGCVRPSQINGLSAVGLGDCWGVGGGGMGQSAMHYDASKLT